METPEPERLATPALLVRLQSTLREVRDRAAGLDLLFGLESPLDMIEERIRDRHAGVWLVYQRPADVTTGGCRRTCCGTSPQPMPIGAAVEALQIAIALVEEDPMFNRCNLQFRPYTHEEYLGLAEFRSGMDWHC